MPVAMPTIIAISTAMSGLRSMVVSRSVLAPDSSRALAAVLEMFWRVLSTASKTVFVVVALWERMNSETDDVNLAISSRSAARSAVKSRLRLPPI